MANKPEAVINLHIMTPEILTTKEFDAVVKELHARKLADDMTGADMILARIILDNSPRASRHGPACGRADVSRSASRSWSSAAARGWKTTTSARTIMGSP
jgi:hypothetical protein